MTRPYQRIAVLTALLSGYISAADLRILSIEPTVLFPRQQSLRQVAFMTIWNAGADTVQADAVVRVDGASPEVPIAVKAAPGATRVRVLVPDIAKPASVSFELHATTGGDVLDHQTLEWQPQRKWKVFVVRSSHEDLGYENYIFRKQRDIANFIDIAREISGHTENLSELERKSDARYHYTMESLLFQRNYIEERGEAAWRRVIEKDVKTGRIHLMGAPSGVHSHWMDYEEIARMAYPAKRETLDRFGLDLKTFMIVDNPSLSWSGAQALANAGFKYVARWGQSWRTNGNNDYARTKVPALFWWKTPDGSRILFGWRSHYGLSFWYGQAGGGYRGLIEDGAEHVTRTLKEVESGGLLGPYPYDALINPEYIDHDIPRFEARALAAWRQQWEYPLIRIASPDEFFEYIEEKYRSVVPELSGDLNNFSADYSTIDPESQGQKRRAARVLPLAEGFAALASYLEANFAPVTAKAARIWTRLFDYDEHSWPTLPPASDVQLFNANYLKKQEAARALNAADGLLHESWRTLAGQIPAPARSVVVFNPLAHTRDDLVTVAEDVLAVRDSVSGEVISCQKVEGGKSVFIARNVPAFGYKVYSIAASAATLPGGALVAEKDRLANQFYEIRFDLSTGTIASIKDRQSGREIVNQDAKHRFNQMVYVHKQGREALEGTEYSPRAISKSASSKGPVRADFDVWIDDATTGAAIRQTVSLYEGIPRIDIVNRLEHVRVLYSDSYEDRYKDNIFYAFPVAVQGGQPRVEYPGGVARPFKDQLRWGSHDYLQANRWVDVSTPQFGVTIAPWNAANFHFGEIRYNRFSIDYEPKSPHLFSYAWSNRMAGLLTLTPEDCNATLGYSLRAHAGDWNSGETTRFGWAIASPLEAFIVEPNATGRLNAKQMSFLSVDAPNVELTVLKQSEQPGRGYVMRFVETAGKATDFTVNSPFLPVSNAFECDLVENDRRALQVTANKIRVKVPAFGFATVRIATGKQPATPANVTARATSDGQVTLAWQPVPAAHSYFVYRSDDPDAPPTAYTLVARTSKPALEDSGLNVGTEYTYRVAAVSRSNQQAAPSEPVRVATSTMNTTPPARIEELGVVRRAADRLMVYWRKLDHPDVARYFLYRSEAPGIDVRSEKPIATLKPSGDFLELYVDSALRPGKTYYYKVVAEDWAANRQMRSPETHATTPLR